MSHNDGKQAAGGGAGWRRRFRLTTLFWAMLVIAAFLAGRHSLEWYGGTTTRVTWPVHLHMQPGQRATISFANDLVEVEDDILGGNGGVSSAVVRKSAVIEAHSPGKSAVGFKTVDGTHGFFKVTVGYPMAGGEAELWDL